MGINNNVSEITVIIPVYNGAQTIKKCVESVMNQSLILRECIVVDDGSIDETYSILEKMKSIYRNLSVYHRPNIGVSESRNYAISQISGGM